MYICFCKTSPQRFEKMDIKFNITSNWGTVVNFQTFRKFRLSFREPKYQKIKLTLVQFYEHISFLI